MKTQITSLVKGTPHVLRNEISSRVISENAESMIIEFNGVEMNLTANYSLSRKSVTYAGSFPISLYKDLFGNFGLPEINPTATIIINGDMTCNIQTNSKKSFWNNICSSKITIK